MKAAGHLAGHHVASYSHDEQFPEARIEHELRRHAGITAPEDGGERLLSGARVASDATVTRSQRVLATEKPLVSVDEPLQRLVSGNSRSRLSTYV